REPSLDVACFASFSFRWRLVQGDPVPFAVLELGNETVISDAASWHQGLPSCFTDLFERIFNRQHTEINRRAVMRGGYWRDVDECSTRAYRSFLQRKKGELVSGQLRW